MLYIIVTWLFLDKKHKNSFKTFSVDASNDVRADVLTKCKILSKNNQTCFGALTEMFIICLFGKLF